MCKVAQLSDLTLFRGKQMLRFGYHVMLLLCGVLTGIAFARATQVVSLQNIASLLTHAETVTMLLWFLEPLSSGECPSLPPRPDVSQDR